MPFTPRNWTDGSAPAVSAANIEDLETRTTDYADTLEGQHILNVQSYGATGDGTTDDTAAIQDAIDDAKTNGGIVFFPSGTYKITSTLDCSNPTKGFRMTGATGMGHVYNQLTTLLWTGGAGSGSMLDCTSVWSFELDHLRFRYNNAAYNGDLIKVVGSGWGDCTNWHIHHCSSIADGASTARSIIRLNQVVIGWIDHCHFGSAINHLRLGDVDGSYVNGVYITDCTFNWTTDAFIFVASPDAEKVTIERCVFEANSAIRGATTAEDGANNSSRLMTVRDCWYGDMPGSGDQFIRTLIGNGEIIGNLVYNGGTADTAFDELSGTWTLIGNGVDAGNIFGDNAGAHTYAGAQITTIGNIFSPSPTEKVWETNPPAAWVTLGDNMGATGDHPTQNGAMQASGAGIGLPIASISTNDLEKINNPLAIGSNGSIGPPSGENRAYLYWKAGVGGVMDGITLQIPGDDAARYGILAEGVGGTARFKWNSTGIGFYGEAPVAKPEITGSAGGNAALQDLLASLEAMGLITDSST